MTMTSDSLLPTNRFKRRLVRAGAMAESAGGTDRGSVEEGDWAVMAMRSAVAMAYTYSGAQAV